MFLLIASYYFYMNWKPVYALLILTSTVITFICSKWIANPANSEVGGDKKEKGMDTSNEPNNQFWHLVCIQVFQLCQRIGVCRP